MNYFLDTNVGLGYVFCTNPWNDKSEHLFNIDSTFYISYCVSKELDKKYNDILKQQKNFFYTLRDKLESEPPSKTLTLTNLKTISLVIGLERDFDDNLKEEIVKVLWKRCKATHVYDPQLNEEVCSVENLLKYIKKFSRGFEIKVTYRLLNFKREVIESEKRDKTYYDLNEKLLNEIEIHYPDNCIILDAHDLSLKDKINLNFISADKKMIENVKTIADLLSIDNFYYLKEFC